MVRAQVRDSIPVSCEIEQHVHGCCHSAVNIAIRLAVTVAW